jgi:hypothetical protein
LVTAIGVSDDRVRQAVDLPAAARDRVVDGRPAPARSTRLSSIAPPSRASSRRRGEPNDARRSGDFAAGAPVRTLSTPPLAIATKMWPADRATAAIDGR